jgi:glycogen debranching enzyme
MIDTAPKGLERRNLDSLDLPEYYVHSDTSLVQRSLRTLKHGNAFAVLDEYGDIGVGHSGPQGLYFHDTRFLSWFELRFEGKRPMFLSSGIQDDNTTLTVDLANPDIHDLRSSCAESISIPRDSIAFERTKFLWQSACYERIGFRNYSKDKINFRLELYFGADFRDLFEVRGTPRKARGTTSAEIVKSGVEFHYRGLDLLERKTLLRFWPEPHRLETHHAAFEFTIEPNGSGSVYVSVLCEDHMHAKFHHFSLALRDKRREIRATTEEMARVETSNELFNEVLCRATSDLYMLMTKTDRGLYPYAGIPWYSTAFGRDGIITAMQMLWVDPEIAKGVLTFLAATQAKSHIPKSDAQPGKILHETRNGEMARLGEVPFKAYFGTVDATPLFIMLASRYFERTGDVATLRAIWPNIKAALAWIDIYGDKDGDGFVEYARETETGLANQGWKDSFDSIFHADGSLAQGPIALCEVQAYVYAAKLEAAKLAVLFGEDSLAADLVKAAAILQANFEAHFWCEAIGTYALALDGQKRPCAVRTSNAGHALFAGIASQAHAQTVAATLMNRQSFSGWGIRTVASGEARYNPISYHNGSVWPHDNSLIALGFANYGLIEEAAQLFGAMFAAAIHQDLRRLPELFCGFSRKPRRGPVSYPVACAPQAWAAAVPFAYMQACFGLTLQQDKNVVCFTDPVLPDFLDTVDIKNLSLNTSKLHLKLQRYGKDATLNVVHRQGSAKVMLQK